MACSCTLMRESGRCRTPPLLWRVCCVSARYKRCCQSTLRPRCTIMDISIARPLPHCSSFHVAPCFGNVCTTLSRHQASANISLLSCNQRHVYKHTLRYNMHTPGPTRSGTTFSALGVDERRMGALSTPPDGTEASGHRLQCACMLDAVQCLAPT